MSGAVTDFSVAAFHLIPLREAFETILDIRCQAFGANCVRPL